jgi:hypothetical protein|tara:strand:- start:180 stop:389 length:210 start_codon:yes stop_codon:yes gene_type:complete
MKTKDPKLQAILDMNKDVGTVNGVKEKPNVELMEDNYVEYLLGNDSYDDYVSNDVSEWDDVEDGDWVLD